MLRLIFANHLQEIIQYIDAEVKGIQFGMFWSEINFRVWKNGYILFKTLWVCVPNGLIDNPALVQIFARCRAGDKLLFGGLVYWHFHASLSHDLLKNMNRNTPGTTFTNLTFVQAWITHAMPSKMWDDNTYPFSNLNGCTIEIWKWIRNFIPHFIKDIITYPCWG